MAAVANYRDKLINAGAAYTASPKYGIEYWEELGSSSSPSKKPSDNATVGATVGGNLFGLVDTPHIALNAATEHSHVSSSTYNPGTEIQQVNFSIPTQYGSVALVISYFFSSNYSATIGHSFCAVKVTFNGATIFHSLTTQVVNEFQVSGTTLLMSNQVLHLPAIDESDSVVITDDTSNTLITESGQSILQEDAGEALQDYVVTVEYAATGDGVRGLVNNLVVSALVLKR